MKTCPWLKGRGVIGVTLTRFQENVSIVQPLAKHSGGVDPDSYCPQSGTIREKLDGTKMLHFMRQRALLGGDLSQRKR